MRRQLKVMIAAGLLMFSFNLQIYPEYGFAKPKKDYPPSKQPISSPAPIAPAPEPAPASVPTPVPTPEPAPITIQQMHPASGLSKEVVGYYAEDWVGDNRSLTSLNTYGANLAAIATFSYQLKGDGTLSGSTPTMAIEASRSAGSKALVLVHNFTNGVFDQSIVHTVLNDSVQRAKLVENILSLIKTKNFDGVNIDLENIPSTDRSLLNQFISDLSQTLHANGSIVTISVPAKTYDATTGWGGAFDYKSLGVYADRVMLMTYDEHWFGGSPGPVASIGWVEQVVKYAASQISPGKLELGLGTYGYDWEVATGKTTRALPTKNALQLASQNNATINWDSTAQVPYFYYWANGVKHVVWFESANSAALKMNLVNQYHLAGVAIWRLGFEEAGFWQMISQKFALTF